MKKNFLFLLLLFVSGLSFGADLPTQNIRGQVLDKTTQLPLPGATVILLNSQPLKGTSTDLNGQFILSAVPIGRHSLRFSFVGYKEADISNITVNTGKETLIEIQLEELVITQNEVVVSAQADKSNPISTMAVVSARGFTVEESARYAGSRNDVARMASNYAGVTGSNDARNDIIIRGNSPIGLLWQVEGIPVPNPNHYGSSTATGGPVSMLNNNVLMNSDFLTAAFPASFGNALSGVFDLRLRNGNDQQHEFLGQVGFNGFEFGAEGPLNKANGSSYIANFRYSTLELMDKLGADFGTGTGIPNYKDFSVKFNFPRTRLGSISFFALGGTSDIEIWDSRRDTTDEKLDFYGGEGFDLTNGSDMVTAGINHFYSYNKNTFSRLTLSTSYHRFITNIDSLTPPALTKTQYYNNDLKQLTLSGKFVLSHRLNSRNNFSTGVLIQQTRFNLDEGVYFSEDNGIRKVTDFDGDGTLYQAFGEWKHKFNDQITANAGLHGMVYGLNNTGSVEPRLGVSWQLGRSQTIGFGYGLQGQVNPISVYFRQTRMQDGSFNLLNKSLPYAKSHHLVLSYDRQLTAFMRLKIESYAQFIYHAGVDGGEQNTFSMLNQGANFGFITPDTLIATGKGRNLGLELTFEHFLNKGFYFLYTASLFDSKYQGSDEVWRNSAFNGNYVTNLLIGKEWNLGKKQGKGSRFTLSADLKTTLAGGQRYTPSDVVADPASPGNFKQEYDYNNAFTKQFSDYSRTDIKLAFRINGKKITQEWAIDAQNIFDQQNIYSEKFNKATGEKSFTYQTGRLIIPQYRIIF